MLNFCFRFALSLFMQDVSLLLFFFTSWKWSLRRVDRVLSVFFFSVWYLFRPSLVWGVTQYRTSECGLPSPTLPLLMSTEMEIIIASNVSLLDSKIVHMEMIGLFYNSCYRSFAKSDRCHCFIHMLCFQGFLLFSTFRSKQWVQRETKTPTVLVNLSPVLAVMALVLVWKQLIGMLVELLTASPRCLLD